MMDTLSPEEQTRICEQLVVSVVTVVKDAAAANRLDARSHLSLLVATITSLLVALEVQGVAIADIHRHAAELAAQIRRDQGPTSGIFPDMGGTASC